MKGRIFCFIGKSASGKDTIYNCIHKEIPELKQYVTYTTRPMRSGECNGREYFFVSESDYNELKSKGRIIEERDYDTVNGLWRYFTVCNETIDLTKYCYSIIGTLEMYKSLCDYFGKETIVPIFITVDDAIRLERAIEREKTQENPNFVEMCRRFVADSVDFSEEKIATLNITKSFYNSILNDAISEIKEYIIREGDI